MHAQLLSKVLGLIIDTGPHHLPYFPVCILSRATIGPLVKRHLNFNGVTLTGGSIVYILTGGRVLDWGSNGC